MPPFVDGHGEAWDRHVDENTKLAYWYNGVTGESLWEEVPGFHPHDARARQVPPQRERGGGGGGGGGGGRVWRRGPAGS